MSIGRCRRPRSSERFQPSHANRNNSLIIYSTYRDQAWAARLRGNATLDFFTEIPVTAKSVVRDNTASFHIPHVGEADGGVVAELTSGSTGEPMKVLKTQRHFRMNAVENRRLKEGWDLEGHMRILALE